MVQFFWRSRPTSYDVGWVNSVVFDDSQGPANAGTQNSKAFHAFHLYQEFHFIHSNHGVSETCGFRKNETRTLRILTNELFELLFVGMFGNFCEKLFVFLGGKVIRLGELVKMRELKVKFGHALRVELNGLVKGLGPERALLRKQISFAKKLVNACGFGFESRRVFEDLDRLRGSSGPS